MRKPTAFERSMVSERARNLRIAINPRNKPIKRHPRPVKAKCMNCGCHTTITDKDQPCPVCALCGSLAWQDCKELK